MKENFEEDKDSIFENLGNNTIPNITNNSETMKINAINSNIMNNNGEMNKENNVTMKFDSIGGLRN